MRSVPAAGHRAVVMQRDEYLKLAEVEDDMWYFRSLHGHARRELELRHATSQPLSLLDAGCGTGGLLVRMRKANPNWIWTGIDFMPLACDLARERCPGCEIVQASVTALPFADARFDAVASVDVLSQVPYPNDAFAGVRELARVLKPGGTLVINVPAYQWMWSYHDESCQTRHRFAADEVRRLFESAGLRVSRLTRWNALTFPMIVAKRKIFVRRGETSDVKPQAPWVEACMRGLMGLEHAWLGLGAGWGWGTSILAVAVKS
ncbi:MAG: methyltransferase domain-containing protein [Opitutaceae bacterium]|nr:methyltransferase domain-containing protein [Opitutaceae bacterium]